MVSRGGGDDQDSGTKGIMIARSGEPKTAHELEISAGMR
jgi:hypothetical protein